MRLYRSVHMLAKTRRNEVCIDSKLCCKQRVHDFLIVFCLPTAAAIEARVIMAKFIKEKLTGKTLIDWKELRVVQFCIHVPGICPKCPFCNFKFAHPKALIEHILLTRRSNE